MKKILSVFIALILLVGCGAGVSSSVNATKTLNAGSLGTVAVLNFSGYRGEIFADLVSHEMLRYNISVIERSRISAILSERNLQQSDIASGKIDWSIFHKILGVDVLVFGSVNPIIIWSSGLPSSRVSTASVRVVSVLDGRILASAAFSSNTEYMVYADDYSQAAEKLIKSLFGK